MDLAERAVDPNRHHLLYFRWYTERDRAVASSS